MLLTRDKQDGLALPHATQIWTGSIGTFCPAVATTTLLLIPWRAVPFDSRCLRTPDKNKGIGLGEILRRLLLTEGCPPVSGSAQCTYTWSQKLHPSPL